MAKLWTFSINVETGEIEEDAYESDDHSDDFSSQSPSLLEGGMTNIVDYNNFAHNCVYVESDQSSEHAMELVAKFCERKCVQFAHAAGLARGEDDALARTNNG